MESFDLASASDMKVSVPLCNQVCIPGFVKVSHSIPASLYLYPLITETENIQVMAIKSCSSIHCEIHYIFSNLTGVAMA